MASLTRTRAEHESRLLEEKKRAERGKNLVVLMLQHLTNAGYTGTVEALTAESGVSLAQYEVCDNIELISTLQEWEEYYELKFARKPKIVKKLSQYSEGVNGPGAMAAKGVGGGGAAAARAARRARGDAGAGGGGGDGDEGSGAGHVSARGGGGAVGRRVRTQPNSGADSKENGAKGAHGDPGDAAGAVDPTGLVVSGHVPGSHELNGKNANGRRGADDDTEGPGHWENRLRKAGLPPAMAANAELRELASWLARHDQRNPNVRWDDIAELQDVKRVLKESLVMPLRYPEYFTGLLQPWKGVLLYARRARARRCWRRRWRPSATRPSSTSPPPPLSASGAETRRSSCGCSLSSHGTAPSTIFVDEIDALMGSRGESGEHEGSRRMKTELLVQMDGLFL